MCCGGILRFNAPSNLPSEWKLMERGTGRGMSLHVDGSWKGAPCSLPVVRPTCVRLVLSYIGGGPFPDNLDDHSPKTTSCVGWGIIVCDSVASRFGRGGSMSTRGILVGGGASLPGDAQLSTEYCVSHSGCREVCMSLRWSKVTSKAFQTSSRLGVANRLDCGVSYIDTDLLPVDAETGIGFGSLPTGVHVTFPAKSSIAVLDTTGSVGVTDVLTIDLYTGGSCSDIKSQVFFKFSRISSMSKLMIDTFCSNANTDFEMHLTASQICSNIEANDSGASCIGLCTCESTSWRPS